MFDKLMLASLVVLGGTEIASAQFGSPDAKLRASSQQKTDWEQLYFGHTLDDGKTYQIAKLVLEIPRNSKQQVFGPAKGLFKSDDVLLEMEVTDRARLKSLEQSLQSSIRLEQHRWLTPFGQAGQITVVTTNGEFAISVSELGFHLGSRYPSDGNTFFNWTLAKILDDEAQRISQAGLKEKHFDVLSGRHWIDSQISRYPKQGQSDTKGQSDIERQKRIATAIEILDNVPDNSRRSRVQPASLSRAVNCLVEMSKPEAMAAIEAYAMSNPQSDNLITVAHLLLDPEHHRPPDLSGMCLVDGVLIRTQFVFSAIRSFTEPKNPEIFESTFKNSRFRKSTIDIAVDPVPAFKEVIEKGEAKPHKPHWVLATLLKEVGIDVDEFYRGCDGHQEVFDKAFALKIRLNTKTYRYELVE